jgi:hypothetical protein
MNPRIAAQYHCDKHVLKMIIETAQLLYSVHWTLNSPLPVNAYKLSHKNHPCAVWARTSITNYLWLCTLGWWLCKEYQYRYGELKVHKTESHITWLLHNHPVDIPYLTMTAPALAMPEQFKCENPIRAYRKFYIGSKLKERGIVKYKCREPPLFLIHYIQHKPQKIQTS